MDPNKIPHKSIPNQSTLSNGTGGLKRKSCIVIAERRARNNRDAITK